MGVPGWERLGADQVPSNESVASFAALWRQNAKNIAANPENLLILKNYPVNSCAACFRMQRSKKLKATGCRISWVPSKI